MKLLDRHILSEIVPMFFFGIIAFTTLFLGAGVFYQMINFAIEFNVSFWIVFQIFMLKLPEFIAYTLPMSSLFCVLLGFNKLSNDLEVTAFRSAGISFFRLMVPVLIFGFVVSIGALLLKNNLAPVTNVRSNMLEQSIRDSASRNYQQQNTVLVSRGDGEVKSIMYAKNMDGMNFEDVSHIELQDGRFKKMTIAREGTLKSTYWVFRNGTQITFNEEAEPVLFVNFPEMDIIVDQGLEDIAREKTRVHNYTYSELRERIKLLREQKNIDEPALRRLKVDFFSKLSIPFASFAFVMIAAPLGLKPQRASSSVGLGVSVIIIFIYYFLQQVFRALGTSYIDPFLAAWLPNTVLFVVGIYLVYKASK